MNNKKLFSALREKIESDCGAVEDFQTDPDYYSFISTTLSGEEDYREIFSVVPKIDKIDLFIIHEFDVGYWPEETRNLKKIQLKELLRDKMDQCDFEDYEDLFDDDYNYFQTNCSNSKTIDMPEGTPKEVSDKIINHFWEMTQKQWDETTKIIEKFNRDN